MTELNNLVRVEPVAALSELRFPVAYSHGGFAQLRHALSIPETNPIGPIQVPASFETALSPEYAGTGSDAAAVMFLRA